MTAPLSSPPLPHLRALTGLRGIAAWFVVLYHIRLSLTALLPQPVIDVFAKGYLAVDLFFMLSGFVMWLNYADRLRASGLAGTGAFLWRRLARIWPLHFAVLSGFIAFALLLLVTGRHDPAAYPFAELPLHLLLMQNWGLTADLTWNHPAWSISTELAAYILFPLLVVTVNWDTVKTPVLLALLALLVAALNALFQWQGHAGLGDAIANMGLPRCLIEFAMGTILCALWKRWLAVRQAKLACAAATIAAAGLWLGLGLAETLIVPVLFASLLLALALNHGPVAALLGGRVLHYLGEISYATYLVHFLLFILFKLAFVDASLQIGAGGLMLFCLVLLILSAALYHGLEKPAQAWLNARAPGMQRHESIARS